MRLAARAWCGVLLVTAALLVPHAAGGRGRRGDAEAEYTSPATVAYKQADVRINAAHAAYRNALLPVLRSADPYQRRLALDRLTHAGLALFDRDVQAALLPLLEETALLPSQTCAREPARCGEAPAVSNGMRAAQLRRSDVLPELLVAHIVARPAAVNALIAAGASLTAKDVSTGLATAKHPAAQAALLRLALPSPCGYAMAPPSVVALQDSPDVTVRRLAALALLRFTGCRSSTDAAAAEVRKRPLASVAARFTDASDGDVVADCARIGEAAEPFVPQLIARLQRRAGNDRERKLALETLAALGTTAKVKDAVPQLRHMLADPAERPLRGAVLAALGAAWPHATPATKPALLALIAAEPERFTSALALLSRADARLTAAELARLNAAYRRGCIDDGNDACRSQSQSLHGLARASRLAFEPLGSDGRHE